MIFLSAYALKSAYGTDILSQAPYLQQHSLSLNLTQTLKPTFDGTVKQLELRILSSATNEDEKTVFAAIRGSAPMVDWLINFNGEDVDAPFPSSDPGDAHNTIRAHRGFLGVAEKMEPLLTRAIRDMLSGGENLVITGHSAGGGVAALLFLHCMARKTFGDTKISCVTFAAPPVVSRNLNPGTLPPDSTFLFIINENDPVPRADRSYIMSFADLYAAYKADAAALNEWRPPVPRLHVPGDSKIVILRPRQQCEEMRVNAHGIEIDEFEKTVALDAEAHKMAWYLDGLRVWDENR
ncbi:alpha/beta-hydrolase [Setomelanomma holmii]|uniref:Alpha/beta-hydrolase n=1 Tax=Setomelanomma holmii TaxID=210430 RepID=A0A9P4HFZ1_9PLEO|nr:alpha/beta-hydrolase [Setomelanomma holmii]